MFGKNSSSIFNLNKGQLAAVNFNEILYFLSFLNVQSTLLPFRCPICKLCLVVMVSVMMWCGVWWVLMSSNLSSSSSWQPQSVSDTISARDDQPVRSEMENRQLLSTFIIAILALPASGKQPWSEMWYQVWSLF